MPELPEVETVVRGLNRLIVGKKIQTYSCDNFKSFPNNEAQIAQFFLNSTINSVSRRGKAILIELDSNYTLIAHLKMTGQLVFVGKNSHDRKNKDAIKLGIQAKDLAKAKSENVRFGGGHPSKSMAGKLPDKSTRIIINFADKSKLFFNDQRKFGWIHLLPTALKDDHSFIKKLGPEPLEKNFTNKIFIQQVRRRKNSAIKAVILDQTVLAGVGNIYADESLWMSKIHPESRVINLSDKQLILLRKSIIDILNVSIKNGGSTDKNYVDAEGNKGTFLNFANIFRLEGNPCKKCATTIEKIRVAGRGTHYCPTCQTKI